MWRGKIPKAYPKNEHKNIHTRQKERSVQQLSRKRRGRKCKAKGRGLHQMHTKSCYAQMAHELKRIRDATLKRPMN